MREILFRGKRFDNGKWVEGLLWKKKYDTPKLFMSYFPNKDDDEYVVVIDPETVGQYTGKTDMYGVKIFEGDRVRYDDDEIAEIEWDEQTARFILSCDGVIYDFDNFRGDELEVIGNIYKTPNC